MAATDKDRENQKTEIRRMKNKRLLSLALIALLTILPLSAALAAGAEEPATNVLRVGFFAFSGYHIQQEDGRRSGYGYDFLQMLATHAGWTYEYVTMPPTTA